MIVLDLGSRDINRIYQVELLVSKFYKISLLNFITKYKYDSLFVGIVKEVTKDVNYNRNSNISIELEESLDDRYYTVENKFSMGVDNRRVVERIISLGVNWVVEDVIVHKSSSVFLLTGCDNERDLLCEPINNTPDIRYVGSGESFYVEVCSDFTRFMEKNKRYDLRKLKYIKLEDLLYVNKVKTLLLFVDVVNKTFFCTWFVSRDISCHNKYLFNTVTYEFDENIKFKGLIELFEYCKTCQPNPSLYSNFNVEEKVKLDKSSLDDSKVYEDDGYWQSLYDSEPTYIKPFYPPSEKEILQYLSDDDYFEATYDESEFSEEELREIDKRDYGFIDEPPPEQELVDISEQEYFDVFGDGSPFFEGSPF